MENTTPWTQRAFCKETLDMWSSGLTFPWKGVGSAGRT